MFHALGLAIALAVSSLFPTVMPQQAITTAINSTVLIKDDVHIHDREELTPPDMPVMVVDKYDQDVLDHGACSGFVVYSQGTTVTIVTARHCHQEKHTTESYDLGDGYKGQIVWNVDITPKRVIFADGDIGIVKSIYDSPTHDIGVLTVQSMRRHPKVFLHEGFARGQALFVIGMPDGTPWAMSTAVSMQGAVYHGTLEEPPVAYPFKYLYALDCPSCSQGDSGAGVFNANGQVVGFVDAGDDKKTLIMPAKDIIKVLRSYKN